MRHGSSFAEPPREHPRRYRLASDAVSSMLLVLIAAIVGWYLLL